MLQDMLQDPNTCCCKTPIHAPIHAAARPQLQDPNTCCCKTPIHAAARPQDMLLQDPNTCCCKTPRHAAARPRYMLLQDPETCYCKTPIHAAARPQCMLLQDPNTCPRHAATRSHARDPKTCCKTPIHAAARPKCMQDPWPRTPATLVNAWPTSGYMQASYMQDLDSQYMQDSQDPPTRDPSRPCIGMPRMQWRVSHGTPLVPFGEFCVDSG